ncbi:porin [Paraburkholderia humisilvae]|uniref:Outer membrane porin protein 32 n=1 Tax=Paraburkholderia humisilvae TaxID=627669 RepID=A0A6J5F4E7_9BURK|nr:porin [Paraburkholderia humisilvae]CAB3773719.1 Outer membrane porin protein 32 [Paraburkholderia humisilvae]
MVKHHLSRSAMVLALTVIWAKAAHAEVTLYGILDTFVGYTNAGGKGAQVAEQSGGLYASRVGLRGSEDLGGGMRATFDLENGILTNNGAATDSTLAFSRNAWVGLANRYGEVRLGRQNSALLIMHSKFDAFNGGTYGSFLHNASTFTFRYDNMITYWSPNVAGFTFSAGVSFGGQTSPHDALNAYVGAVDYQRGPLYLGVSHAEQNGANGQLNLKTTFAGGSYQFGSLTGYFAFYRGNNLGANLNTNVEGKYHSVYWLSAGYMVSPALHIAAGIGYVQDSTAQNNNAGEVSLGAFYNLSKRTLVYTTVARLVNRHGATYSLIGNGPITPNTPVRGEGVTGAQLGIVQFF